MVTESELYVKDISESRMSPYAKYLYLWSAHKMSLQLESVSGNSIFSSITCLLNNSLLLELLRQSVRGEVLKSSLEKVCLLSWTWLGFVVYWLVFDSALGLSVEVFGLDWVQLTRLERELLSVSIPHKNTHFLTGESPYCSARAIGLHILASQWFILTKSLGKCNLFVEGDLFSNQKHKSHTRISHDPKS